MATKSEIPTENFQIADESGQSHIQDTESDKAGSKDHHAQLTVDEAREIAIGTIDEVFTIESDNSPFPEVRANVPNVDDVDLPINTLRMWFLGVVFTMVCSLIIYCLLSKHFTKFDCRQAQESINFSQCDTPALRSLRLLPNY